jgi:hypothetical protein
LLLHLVLKYFGQDTVIIVRIALFGSEVRCLGGFIVVFLGERVVIVLAAVSARRIKVAPTQGTATVETEPDIYALFTERLMSAGKQLDNVVG